MRHRFALGFDVDSALDADHVTSDEVVQALLRRLAEVIEGGIVVEATYVETEGEDN